MDDNTIKNITALKQTFGKAKAAKKAEDDKLMAVIEKHIGKDGGKDRSCFEEVMGILMPVNYKSFTCMDLWDSKIYRKGRRKKTDKALSEEAKEEIRAQVEAFSEKNKQYEAEEEKLKKYVEAYMRENRVYEDEQKLDELINIMPACIQRFWLFDLKFELEKEEGKNGTGKKNL